MICAHYSKHMLCKQDCIKFCGCIAWQSFFENNFADFADVVQVKKNQNFVQPLVVFPISNISYSILHLLDAEKVSYICLLPNFRNNFCNLGFCSK